MVPLFDDSHLLGCVTGAIDPLGGLEFIDQSFEKVFTSNRFLFVRLRMLHFMMVIVRVGLNFLPPQVEFFFCSYLIFPAFCCLFFFILGNKKKLKRKIQRIECKEGELREREGSTKGRVRYSNEATSLIPF